MDFSLIKIKSMKESTPKASKKVMENLRTLFTSILEISKMIYMKETDSSSQVKIFMLESSMKV